MTRASQVQLGGAALITLALALWSFVIAGAFAGAFLICYGIAMERGAAEDADARSTSPTA